VGEKQHFVMLAIYRVLSIHHYVDMRSTREVKQVLYITQAVAIHDKYNTLSVFTIVDFVCTENSDKVSLKPCLQLEHSFRFKANILKHVKLT